MQIVLSEIRFIWELTRKLPELEVAFWPHIFPGERAPSQSDGMDINFCSIVPS
jgi:hypothetical protein